MPEKIIKRKATVQFKQDYVDYAMEVLSDRMIAHLFDGLKPSQRRILYTARFFCAASEARRKSADIVGATMGKFHPHGDSSITGALYNMTTWWQSKVPLFDGQGNFGNTYENSPASMRYTEVKLSKFALDCVIGELNNDMREIIEWRPNYDNSLEEPVYLPTKVPLLLINGNFGIAVGEKADIPTHNLNEVIDATINLIRNPKAPVVLVPDMCQACEIIDTDWKKISTGNGNFKVRGIIDIEPYNGIEKKYNGLQTLVIKSVPNQTFLDKVVFKINEMIKENKITGIIADEEQSEINNMRYVFILAPGTDPNYVRNEIYKNTQMAQTMRVNLKVINFMDNSHPTKRLSYKGYLQAWIDFRKITKLGYYGNLLQKKMTRLHTIENYIWAIENNKIDEIIKIIRATKSTDDNVLIETLIKKFKITDIQAEFLINCEIKKLSKAYLAGFKAEQAKLAKDTNEYRENISDEKKLEQIIINELLEIKEKYGEPRKCRIISEDSVSSVPSGTFKVVITDTNYIKKIGELDPVTKGKNDNVKFVITGDNAKSILLFDSYGKVFDIPIAKIPFADKNSSGIDIRLINKHINSSITSVIYSDDIERFKKGFIVTLTEQGFIKRMTVTDFLSVPSSGLVYCKLDGTDKIIDLLLFGKDGEIIVYGSKKALRIDLSDIPILKRNARGCVSMSSKTTNVEGMCAMNKHFSDIVVVTKNGYINRIIPDSVIKGRSKAGSNVIKLGKTDKIVSIYGVNNNDSLVCLTAPAGEPVEIPIASIAKGASIGTGVKTIKAEVVKVYKK